MSNYLVFTIRETAIKSTIFKDCIPKYIGSDFIKTHGIPSYLKTVIESKIKNYIEEFNENTSDNLEIYTLLDDLAKEYNLREYKNKFKKFTATKFSESPDYWKIAVDLKLEFSVKYWQIENSNLFAFPCYEKKPTKLESLEFIIFLTDFISSLNLENKDIYLILHRLDLGLPEKRKDEKIDIEELFRLSPDLNKINFLNMHFFIFSHVSDSKIFNEIIKKKTPYQIDLIVKKLFQFSIYTKDVNELFSIRNEFLWKPKNSFQTNEVKRLKNIIYSWKDYDYKIKDNEMYNEIIRILESKSIDVNELIIKCINFTEVNEINMIDGKN